MKRLTLTLLILAFLATIALRTVAISEQVVSLTSPEYGEGPLAAFILRWTQESPSRAWSNAPFTGIAYGPLMLAEWRAAAILWPGMDLILLGRLVALTATTILVLAVATIVFREQRSATSSVAAVGLLLASPVALDWFPWARVDTTAATFTALAYIALERDFRRLILSALLLVLASLAKQTAAVHAIPLAWIALTLWGWRTAVRWTLSVTVLGAFAWAGTFVMYDHYFLDASTQAGLNRMSVWMYLHTTEPWLTSVPTVLMLAAAAGFVMIHRANATRNRWWVGFMVSLLVGGLTSLKEGSYVNYFIDATWLGAIVVGCVCADLLRRWPTTTAVSITAALILGLPPSLLHRLERRDAPVASSADRTRRISELAQRGSVLLDGDLIGFLPREVRPLVSDPFLFRLRDDAGIAPTQQLLDALDRRPTTVLFSRSLAAHLSADRLERYWPTAVLSRIESDFCLTEEIPGLFVYSQKSDMPLCLGENRAVHHAEFDGVIVTGSHQCRPPGVASRTAFGVHAHAARGSVRTAP